MYHSILIALTVAFCCGGTIFGTAATESKTQPFGGKPQELPGKIEAEHYDQGKPGEAYRDVDAKNHGVDYRGETQVDIEKRSDASNGHGLGWTRKGEWVVYTVMVNEAGHYDLEIPVASNKKGGTFHLEFDGTDVTGPIDVPDTGGWQKMLLLRLSGIELQKGLQEMKMVMASEGPSGSIADIDYLRFELSIRRTATFSDLAYGPHKMTVLDFWQAAGAGPRPLLVYIHGGGWVGGDKKQRLVRFKKFLDRGISYAAINYRLTGESPLPAPVHDAARAIQFIRSNAAYWNINPDRIALTGGSAGACTSMWILLHDDLANPNSDDPVLKESTRVTAAAVSGGQTSIDPKVIEGWLGPNVLKHRMIWMAVGEQDMATALRNYDQHRASYVEFSPYNHLDGNDPPLFMRYGKNMKLPSENAGHGIHHPMYGVKMKEKADNMGHECHLLIEGVSESERFGSADDFLMNKLLAP